MKPIISIIIFSLISNNIWSQKNLTKNEIIAYWNTSYNKINPDSITIVHSSSTLNAFLLKLVDSLRSNNIDSVIIFSTAYPGYTSTSKCDFGMFPITTFVIWNKNSLTNIIKLEGSCFFEVTKFSSLHFFDYYGNIKDKIKSENIMPVIFGGQINKNKTITYSMSAIDHEPKYSFYYSIGSDCRSYQFCESYLADKKSLFHYYNSNLAVYHWWNLIKEELDKQDE